jgi:hypothetical protein
MLSTGLRTQWSLKVAPLYCVFGMWQSAQITPARA